MITKEMDGAYIILRENDEKAIASYKGKGNELVSLIIYTISVDEDFYRIVKDALQFYETHIDEFKESLNGKQQ